MIEGSAKRTISVPIFGYIFNVIYLNISNLHSFSQEYQAKGKLQKDILRKYLDL